MHRTLVPICILFPELFHYCCLTRFITANVLGEIFRRDCSRQGNNCHRSNSTTTQLKNLVWQKNVSAHHPPPTSTHTNSMSAISQLLLNHFQRISNNNNINNKQDNNNNHNILSITYPSRINKIKNIMINNTNKNNNNYISAITDLILTKFVS